MTNREKSHYLTRAVAHTAGVHHVRSPAGPNWVGLMRPAAVRHARLIEPQLLVPARQEGVVLGALIALVNRRVSRILGPLAIDEVEQADEDIDRVGHVVLVGLRDRRRLEQ